MLQDILVTINSYYAYQVSVRLECISFIENVLLKNNKYLGINIITNEEVEHFHFIELFLPKKVGEKFINYSGYGLNSITYINDELIFYIASSKKKQDEIPIKVYEMPTEQIIEIAKFIKYFRT